MSENQIGVVTHYYDHLSVAVVKLKTKLKKGEKIRIKGHTTDLEQLVTSMQVEHKQIDMASKGNEIGLKVDRPVKEHDIVYKV